MGDIHEPKIITLYMITNFKEKNINTHFLDLFLDKILKTSKLFQRVL